MPKVLIIRKIINQTLLPFRADFHKAIPFQIKLQMIKQIKIIKKNPIAPPKRKAKLGSVVVEVKTFSKLFIFYY